MRSLYISCHLAGVEGRGSAGFAISIANAQRIGFGDGGDATKKWIF